MQDLLAKYLGGDIMAEEKERLFSMASSDEAFREELLSVMNLRCLSGWLPQDGDIAAALDSLLQFKQQRYFRRDKRKRRLLRTALGYAAAVCIAALATWLAMNSANRPAIEQAAASYEEFITPPGQHAQVKLHDGTVVWLNASSTLRYPNRFEAEERRVSLDGEAFFEVAGNAGRPFVVTTEKADIKVLGTKFDVFAYRGGDGVAVSLTEGSVEVYGAQGVGDTILLKPNERVEIVGGKWKKSVFRDEDFLLWKEGVYAFDDMPFGEIAKKLELYYDVSITIDNRPLEAYKFSGKFRQRDGVESLLQTLQKIRPFSYAKEQGGDRITIK